MGMAQQASGQAAVHVLCGGFGGSPLCPSTRPPTCRCCSSARAVSADSCGSVSLAQLDTDSRVRRGRERSGSREAREAQCETLRVLSALQGARDRKQEPAAGRGGAGGTRY